MNDKTGSNSGKQPSVELSPKEKVLEILALGMCAMLLLGCFLKVVFF